MAIGEAARRFHSPRAVRTRAPRSEVTCSTARPGSTRRATPPTWRCSRCARTASASRSSSRSPMRLAFTGNDFLLQAVMIPFLVFALAAIGLNILTGYAGLLSLGTGAFMGVGAYACYKLTTTFPGVNIIVWILVSGLFSAGIGVLFGLPSPAHQGLLSRGRDARGAVLPAMVLHPRPLALQLQRLRRDRGAAAHAVRRADRRRHRDARDALPRGADASSILLTWIASNLVHGRIGRHVDGDPRHGHRGRAHGHQAPADEAPRLRGVVLSIAASPGR